MSDKALHLKRKSNTAHDGVSGGELVLEADFFFIDLFNEPRHYGKGIGIDDRSQQNEENSHYCFLGGNRAHFASRNASHHGVVD